MKERIYTIKDISEIMNINEMSIWHAMRVNKIIHANGFPYKPWIKAGLCYANKDGKMYRIQLREEGKDKVLKILRDWWQKQ